MQRFAVDTPYRNVLICPIPKRTKTAITSLEAFSMGDHR
jgi:hypothetical protein